MRRWLGAAPGRDLATQIGGNAMLTAFQWFCLFSILAASFAGGFYPQFRQDAARSDSGFPMGEAFTAGVFMALALTLMMPSSFHLLQTEFPKLDYPITSLIVIGTFFFLLALEQISHRVEERLAGGAAELSPPTIPLIMTAMIAIPSFFLGTALGVSETGAAIFIFVAIMVHKSSAAFALALKMVRSTMTRGQVWLAFSLFAFSTPVGIVVGQRIHELLGPHTLNTVKGIILGLAAGTFLYMATVHEFRRAPMIANCNTLKGFGVMLAGFLITAFVRFLIGEAHHMG